MGKFHQLVHGKYADNSKKESSLPVLTDKVVVAGSMPDNKIQTIDVEKLVYVDRPVETQIEVIKYVEVPVEKIVERVIVEYKTVEIPVMVEKIVKVPVEVIREVVREVTPKVIDITDHLTIKKQKRTIGYLKAGIVLSLIINLIILVVK